jgi:hypothetical protein
VIPRIVTEGSDLCDFYDDETESAFLNFEQCLNDSSTKTPDSQSDPFCLRKQHQGQGGDRGRDEDGDGSSLNSSGNKDQLADDHRDKKNGAKSKHDKAAAVASELHWSENPLLRKKSQRRKEAMKVNSLAQQVKTPRSHSTSWTGLSSEIDSSNNSDSTAFAYPSGSSGAGGGAGGGGGLADGDPTGLVCVVTSLTSVFNLVQPFTPTSSSNADAATATADAASQSTTPTKKRSTTVPDASAASSAKSSSSILNIGSGFSFTL